MKQVQIDVKLFTDIVKLVCLEQEDLRKSVQDRLEAKVKKLADHQRYTEKIANRSK